MNAKKVILIVMIITFLINLISCGSLRDKMINSRLSELNQDYKVSDKRSKEIINALENKDKERLKKLFSVNALKIVKDIDGDIEYIMNFFQGEIISVDGGPGYASSSKSNGISVAEDTYKYTITTDKGNYVLFFIYISEDTFSPDNVGLYMIQLINQEDMEVECDEGNKIRCPGIYRPPVSQYTDIKFQDGTEIVGGFKFLKYQEDYLDGKYNMSATIQSEIAYGHVEVSYCFFDCSGEKIGLAVGGKSKLEAGNTFEINLIAKDYDGNDLNYEDIASCRFYGIDAY